MQFTNKLKCTFFLKQSKGTEKSVISWQKSCIIKVNIYFALTGFPLSADFHSRHDPVNFTV